jgi:site-specific recombinase XerD
MICLSIASSKRYSTGRSRPNALIQLEFKEPVLPDLKVVTPTPASALQTLVEDYLAHCRARGLSPNTVNQAYRYPLRGILLPFCAQQGITEVSTLTNRTLDKLSAQLLEGGGRDGRPLSKHSVHSYSRAINHFLSWAKREGETVEAKAQLPKLPKILVEVVSREEIQRMEDAARTERDKLMVRVLADTGLRVDELLGLRTTDLVEQNRNYYLRVRGKGAKDRLVPAPRLYRRLRIYVERGRPRDAVSNRVFLSHRRRPNGGDYEPLTRSGLDQMIRNLGQIANIEKRVYPHLLRHSFATWQLSRGMNPIQLAQILGHSSLNMIQAVYSHLSPGDAYEAMLRTLREEDD